MLTSFRFPIVKFLAISVLTVFAALNAQSASYNCEQSITITEKTICSDPNLSTLDDLLGSIWSNEKRSESDRRDQKNWIAQRDKCGDDTNCIDASYRDRLRTFFNIHNFEILEITSDVQSGKSVLLAKTFYPYNIEYHAFEFGGNGFSRILWETVEYDENRGTCGVTNLSSNIISDTQISNTVVGTLLNEGEMDGSILEEITVWVRWVGHGDQSSQVTYRLVDNKFVISKISIDNCLDQNVSQLLVDLQKDSNTLLHSSNNFFYKWLESQIDKHPTLESGAVIRNKEFQTFLDKNLFNKSFYNLGLNKNYEKANIRDNFGKLLSGPSNQVLVDRYGNFLISGCRYRSCDEKGFVWIDPSEHQSIFGMLIYFMESQEFVEDGILALFSNSIDLHERTPEAFTSALNDWMNLENLAPEEIIILE